MSWIFKLLELFKHPEIFVVFLGIITSVLAKVIGSYFKKRVAIKPQKLELRSPLGESRTIRLKGEMSEEERISIVRGLEELSKDVSIPDKIAGQAEPQVSDHEQLDTASSVIISHNDAKYIDKSKVDEDQKHS
jgi:hypothetical protein